MRLLLIVLYKYPYLLTYLEPLLWRSAVSNQWPSISEPLTDDLLHLSSDQTSMYPFLTISCVQPVTKSLSTPSLTIYCVWPVPECLSTPLWRSTASNQWPNASVSPLWRSTAFNQWPNVTALLFDDLLCQISDQTPQYPLCNDRRRSTCHQTSQHSSLTIYCVNPVTERLCTPLWQYAVSNQWPNVSVSLSDDLLCQTKRLSTPLWRSNVSLSSDQTS